MATARRSTTLLSITVAASLAWGNAVADNDADVTPGAATGKRQEIEAWTRSGPLGPAPKRTTDALPLSDQQGRESWSAYGPLTDEFDGAQLDASKWLPRHRTWRGRQPAWFSEQNVRVADGELQLTMRKETAPSNLKRRGYHTYSSAAVQSVDKVKYGYFEICAQPMNSAGSSSFWFAGHDDRWRTEIDVFELSGKADGFERRHNMNLHVFYSPEDRTHWSIGGRWATPWRVADGFHVYGLDWNEREIVYYIDGVPVRRVENTHWHQPLYMIFDSETMPDWMGLPDDADLPSTYRIKYVRTWKRGADPPEGEAN